MKHKISANSKSVTNAGITSDYKQAIAEFIWNGFDAGASKIIDYEANGLGALTSLSISDNGSGIRHDTIEFTFGAFLDSQKTKTFQRTSDVRGKNGKGRFSFSQFATKATWNTTYNNNEGKKCSFSITISIEDLADFDVSEPTPSPEVENTGTVVSFQNIKDLPEQHLVDATFTEYIAQQFAWFLCLNQVQFKDGKLKFTMGSFTHKPEIVAYFNNDMGILVDSLPKKLEDMGITGVNRKACYKYYFKRGTPLCKTEFDNLSANLKMFIDNRNSNKEDW